MNKFALVFGLLFLLLGCSSSPRCVIERYEYQQNSWTKISKKSCKAETVVGTGFQHIEDAWYYVDVQGYKRYFLISKDTSQFQVLSPYFAKDSQHVYFKKQIISHDPKHFHFLTDKRYAADSKQVYYEGQLLENANPSTFKQLDYRYSIDGKSVYWYDKRIKGADAQQFKIIDNVPLAKYLVVDSEALYIDNQRIATKIDVKNLKPLIGYLITDGQHVLEVIYNRLTVRDIKPPITQLTPFLFKDALNRWFLVQIYKPALWLQTIDNTLTPLNYSCPKDYPNLATLCQPNDKKILYVEDGQGHVFSVRYSDKDELINGFDFRLLFKKPKNTTVYLLNLENNNLFLIGNTLYAYWYEDTKLKSLATPISKDAIAIRNWLLVDKTGFIYLYRADKDDPHKFLRLLKAEDLGSLTRYKQQIAHTKAVLENNSYIYVFWQNQTTPDYIINKQTLEVKYNILLRPELVDKKVSATTAAKLLEYLGLSKDKT